MTDHCDIAVWHQHVVLTAASNAAPAADPTHSACCFCCSVHAGLHFNIRAAAVPAKQQYYDGDGYCVHSKLLQTSSSTTPQSQTPQSDTADLAGYALRLDECSWQPQEFQSRREPAAVHNDKPVALQCRLQAVGPSIIIQLKPGSSAADCSCFQAARRPMPVTADAAHLYLALGATVLGHCQPLFVVSAPG
jgi:hypothetical protein